MELYIWLVIAALYGPGLFLSAMLVLLAVNVPLSVWRSRPRMETANNRVPA